MTIYTKIDIGTVDDDGTGDTIRAAFAKVNDVFTLQDTTITFDEVNSITAPGAAKGTLWLRDDSPNVLIFSDDLGTEIVLGTAGSGTNIEIQDESVSLTISVTKIDFQGSGVIVTEPISDQVVVTIDATGTNIEIQDESVSLTTSVTKIDFQGIGVTVTEPIADQVVVTIGADLSGTVPDFYEFTASASQTIFIGVDDNSNTLSYTSGQIIVYVNGNALDSSDYTATNGTSIVLNEATDLNDIIFIISFAAGITISDAPSNGLIFGRKDGVWIAFSGGLITVQDNGSDLTTDVTKLNFVGFTITEPVADEITITSIGNAIIVEDNGTPLTIDVTKLNFVGFTLTEPVTDEITITSIDDGLPSGGTIGQFLIKQSATDGDATWEDFGVQSVDNVWCPGYTFGFVDVDTFKIVGFDVTDLFSSSRRVKFALAGVDIFGTIDSSTFSAGDTTVEITMESGATLADSAYEICFVSGNTSWSPIAGDPFSGTPINSIATGSIASTEYWIICGDAGRVAFSTDKGVTWTSSTITLTKNLYHVEYDSANEYFFIGGDDGALLFTSNGTTYTEDTTTIAALGFVSGDCHGLAFTEEDVWWYYFHYVDNVVRLATSIDQGSTWTFNGEPGRARMARATRMVYPADTVAGANNQILGIFDGNVGVYNLSVRGDTTWFVTFTFLGAVLQYLNAWDTTAGNDISIAARSGGNIQGLEAWTGIDTTTFTDVIWAFAHSQSHDRIVLVGSQAMIGYWNFSDRTSNNTWNTVSNGFSPSVTIQCVAFNEVDGVFVAGAANGQICRSTNGTN